MCIPTTQTGKLLLVDDDKLKIINFSVLFKVTPFL